MNGEETLRDALRDDAKGGATSSDAWDRVRTRAGSIRHRRQVAQRAIGGLTAAAVVVGVVVTSGVFQSDTTVIATPPTGDQIVAVQGPNNGGDHLVVLSADDGQVIRTLADDIGITFGGISATPDGETVYFARLRHDLLCGLPQIAKVPIVGGEVEVVGPGMSPLVSPDGSTLAYVRSPADDPCGRHTELVRHDLATGEDTVEVVAESCDGCGTLSPVSWSPDSSRLLMAGCCNEEWWNSLLVRPIDTPGQTRYLNLSPDADGATYLPDGRILVALEDQDPVDGAQLHKLFEFEGEIGPPENDPPTARDFMLEPIDKVSELESRQNGVLRITANSSGDVLLHFGGDLLQRWRPGDGEPVTITDGIRDATWLPTQQSTPPPEPTSTTTTAPIPPVLPPNQMVVATADRQLEVLDANGNVVRRLGTSGQDIPWIAVAPDGQLAYYEQGTIDPCDAVGEIDTVRLDIYPPGFSGGIAGTSPALSADGTKLAYRYGTCGGELHVRDLVSGEERVWTLGYPNDDGPLSVELVGPVGWDADNEHVIVQVNRDDDTEFWYVHTGSDTDVLIGGQLPKRGIAGQGGPIDFAPLDTPGYWASVHDIGLGDPFVLSDYFAPGGNGSLRDLPDLPAGAVNIVGSATTGQHLLLLVGNDLYRWSGGEASLTLVASNINAADW